MSDMTKRNPKLENDYEQALVTAQEIGDRRSEGAVLGNLGSAYYQLGQVDKAIQYYEQALVIAREIGDRRGEGAWLGNLGSAWDALGESKKAIEYFEQALDIDKQVYGDRHHSVATYLNNTLTILPLFCLVSTS